MLAKLVLEDGSVFTGEAFGKVESTAGEVVFNTGMVGYPECLTDPSYAGQILTLTYPLIGNYGVPQNNSTQLLESAFESDRIHISGLVVSEFSSEFSHWQGRMTFDDWLKKGGIPAVTGIDTRLVTQKLREQGSMLGKIIIQNQDLEFEDPNSENLVARVSTPVPQNFGDGKKKILLIDCGCKFNIVRSLVKRNVSVTTVPWDWDVSNETFDGLFISNGPGDPKMCETTIENIRKVINDGIPTMGICLGHQLLARAAGAETYKLKYGHRSQNQPCILVGTKRCFITSQNHGFAVDEKTLPDDWEPWFFNANDGTNEGIRHRSKPFLGAQFHPEASPGPLDTAFLFDEFINML